VPERSGAERLGLAGLVDAQDMRALYSGFLDPRDPGFRDPKRWDEVATLGHTGRAYLSEDDLYSLALEREPDTSAERRVELRVEAGKDARHNVAQAALAARENAPGPMAWSPQAVIETALAEVQARSAGWTESDLIRALNAALPDYLGLPDGADIGELFDLLAAEAVTYVTPLDAPRPGDEHLPGSLRLANGRSAYEAPGARLYATPDQVRTERRLVAATAAGGGTALPHDRAQRFIAGLAESGIELGVDQAAAVRGVVTSGARVETLIGPAGTGKSFVVGTIARAWTDPTHSGGEVPRRVFGLATSQIATDVLTAEGLTARNVAAWLGIQGRLAVGPGAGVPRPVEGDHGWRLRAGDLVVVDESAMTDTAALAAIWAFVDAAGAKLLLVGDHRQLASVGAGGAMDLLSQSGARYELAEARRFHHEWERDASLRLRAGDESVLREYHQHGRLLDSGTAEHAEESAARAWLGDTLAGCRSLLVVDTNEQAARGSAQIRAELVRLGHVQEHGVELGMQGTYASVGDLVEARKIAWDLAGHEGNPRGPINREHFRVHAVRPDGSLEVTAIIGRTADGDVLGDRLVFPASYVAEHLALGYASTVNAAQGGTVDTTHTVVTARTGPSGFYVGMSRGRDANTAHVVTLTGVEDPAQRAGSHALHRDPVAAVARVLDTTDAAAAATRSAGTTESATQAGSVRTAAELLADASQLAATERTATWLDQLTDTGAITGGERARIAAEDGAASLTRVLRRAELAGHDPRQVLGDAVEASSFDGARNLSNVIYSRIRQVHGDQLDPVGESFADWTPCVDNPEWRDYLAVLADAADQRTIELGREAAEQGAPWAVEAFGPVPADTVERSAWERSPGTVAALRELARHDDQTDAIGPAPKPGQVEQYAPTGRRGARWAARRSTARTSHAPNSIMSRCQLLPPVDEVRNSRVDVVRVGRAEKVLAALDDSQLGVRGVDEPADAVLGVADRVHGVGRAVYPQDRAPHAVQTGEQPVAVAEVDGAGPEPVTACVTRIVLSVRGEPERTILLRHGVAEARLQDRVHELVRDDPVVSDAFGECINRRCAELDPVPATELTAACALEVHRRAERDDPLYLVGGEHGHPGGDPPALRRSQDKGFMDLESLENLEVRDGGVPVRELLVRSACLAVPVRLDGDQVRSLAEARVGELRAVQVDGRGERVDQQDGRERGVVRLAEPVAEG